ncbi:MAG: hypothetical protein ABIR16_03835 [Dokdonella sp.]
MSHHPEITPPGNAMNLFIDTEFSSLKAPELLSIGLVADDGREFYVEIADDRIPVNAFVKRTVLPQWGLMPLQVRSSIELGRHVDKWLSGLRRTSIAVVYDYEADFDLLRNALVSAMCWGRWSKVLVPHQVGFLSREHASNEAMDSSWTASMQRDGIGRHHALADARALREGYAAVHDAQRRRAAECVAALPT